MTAKLSLTFEVPPSLSRDEIMSVLFGQDSGLRVAGSGERRPDELKFEFATIVTVGLFVYATIEAAKSLFELVTLIKDRRREAEPRVTVNITVLNVNYDLEKATPEQITRMLDE